ncbi:DUF4466 domain-containing protein [Fibrisoma montanum]|uniref:DUF4466 domain-containing protein n=2 Tax=Fibrisoma montanum TaxID=2305895 RepID=A0A418M183_9BACT|nr:DUF4466 domain-containing protein [Fibrisoma montanum]
MTMKANRSYLLLLAIIAVGLASCEPNEVENEGPLRNDLLKKTTSPAVIGDRIEFVYALGTLEGTLKAARAEASIPGAVGTGFSRYSWFTNRSTGQDVPVLTAGDTITNGAVSTASILDGDNNKALSLRYYYAVPEEARGKTVTFRFSGTSSTGQEVTVNSPAYRVSRMDMKRQITLKDAEKCYVSLSDMTAYTKEEVEQKGLSGKIDFVYVYRATLGTNRYAFGHALVSLANGTYLSDLNLPASWTRTPTLLDKRVDVKDAQLRGGGFDVYIDDTDLERTTFTNSADFAYNLAADQGAFVRSGDGSYVAYVFVNNVNNTAKTMTVSIKRLQVK